MNKEQYKRWLSLRQGLLEDFWELSKSVVKLLYLFFSFASILGYVFILLFLVWRLVH
jgi:hypothetical protein